MKTEFTLQKNVVLLLEFFKKNQIIIEYHMIPNDIFFNLDKKKGAMYNNFLNSMGKKNGASDLVVICKKKIFYLELKKLNGKQRESQIDFQKKVESCEVATYVLLDHYDKEFLKDLFKNWM